MMDLIRFFEKEYTLEDLTKEEMDYLKNEWIKLDNYDRDYYENFEEFVDITISKVCYPDD